MTPRAASVWFTPPAEADWFLPEGPRAQGDGILWVNIQAGPDATTGDVHHLTWDGRHTRHPMPARPGFVFPTSNPNVVLAGCDKVVGLYDRTTAEWTPLAAIPDTHPRTIINDGEIVPGGRAIVFGTKDVQFAEPIAHLYLFTLDDNQLTVLADGQTCSNGKVFAAGGRTLYDIDTPRKVVTRYRFDLGNRTVAEESVALDLRPRDDFPDGMCDAGDGTVIVAFYNPAFADAGRAVRYRLGTGEVLGEWLTPGSPRVTCPLLIQRPGGVKLILTTADEGMPTEVRASCPNAGCLFIADTDLASVPAAALVVL
jgi:sugar lactone lactonase YvrE